MMKFSKKFYEGFIESLMLEVDVATDRVSDTSGSPHFAYLDELMKVEDRVEQMVENGYLPREVADKALKRFWEYAESCQEYPVQRWDEGSEE